MAAAFYKLGKVYKMTQLKQIDPNTPYVIIDAHNNNKIIAQYKYKNRNRARSYADKLDMQYGASRYYCRLLNTLNNHL